MKLTAILFYPLSLLYGLVTGFRNFLFDAGLFSSVSFPFPVISVGNLSQGGTGKTPHIEFLVKLLSDKYNVAVLSRGYGRKTHGFFIADETSDYQQIGDEPLQYYNKFKKIKVAVCESRVKGIRKLKTLFPEISVVLLDDAFQHRWVKPGLNILLTDFRFLYTDDHIFPSGKLRESKSGAKRADIIVVTKTDKVLPKMLRNHIVDDIKPKQYQDVLFSRMGYKGWVKLPDSPEIDSPAEIRNILLVTGIANPYPLKDHLKTNGYNVELLKFADHHKFTSTDLVTIAKAFDNIISASKLILTTEKDAMRFRDPEIELAIQKFPVYYIPIETVFHNSDQALLSKRINEFIKGF